MTHVLFLRWKKPIWFLVALTAPVYNLESAGVSQAFEAVRPEFSGDIIPVDASLPTVSPTQQAKKAFNVICRVNYPTIPPVPPYDPIPAEKTLTLERAATTLGALGKIAGKKMKRLCSHSSLPNCASKIITGFPGRPPNCPVPNTVSPQEFKIMTDVLQDIGRQIKASGQQSK
jgi:hypothetical protein